MPVIPVCRIQNAVYMVGEEVGDLPSKRRKPLTHLIIVGSRSDQGRLPGPLQIVQVK
jgi:hypothetical protein